MTLQQDTTGAHGLWSGAPQLTSAPGDSGLPAAFDPGTSSGIVAVYNVSDGTFTRTEAKQVTGCYTRAAAFTPDATQVFAADANAVTVDDVRDEIVAETRDQVDLDASLRQLVEQLQVAVTEGEGLFGSGTVPLLDTEAQASGSAPAENVIRAGEAA